MTRVRLAGFSLYCLPMLSSHRSVPRPKRKESRSAAAAEHEIVEDVITPTLVDPPRFADSVDAPLAEVLAQNDAEKPEVASIPNAPAWIANVPTPVHVPSLETCEPAPVPPMDPPVVRESYPPLRESYPPRPSAAIALRASRPERVSSVPPIMMVDERDGSHWRRTAAFRQGFGSRAAAFVASGAVIVTAAFAVVASLVVLARSNDVSLPSAPRRAPASVVPPAESPQIARSHDAPRVSPSAVATAPALSASALLHPRPRIER